MNDLSLFYSSMSSVLSQWSDFRVSKNLYKEYFAMQKANAKTTAETEAEKLKGDKNKVNYKNNVKDKLKDQSDAVSKAVSDLESAFKADAKTGEVDRDKAYEAVSAFVNSYNELFSSVRGSGNAAVSNRSESIANMANAYTRKFGDVGISVGSDGKLSIDKDKFMDASDEELDKVFGKKNSFASYMQTQANGLSAFASSAAYLNPDPYSKTALTQTSSATQNSTASGLLYDKYF